MSLYKGFRQQSGNFADDVTITVDGINFEQLMLQKSLQVRNHSPTGFCWGYGGSGPHQLALALLLHLTEDSNLAETYHHYLVIDHVSRWGDTWEITSDQLNEWLKTKQSV